MKLTRQACDTFFAWMPQFNKVRIKKHFDIESERINKNYTNDSS